MKHVLTLLLSAMFVFGLNAQQLAFPGAEGFGKFAKGARASSSPSVYHVTNLNDSGTGSFRDAVSGSNRIVVFDVAGVIKITSRIVVASNLYIAGQTAPGEGITIYGNGFSFSGADNCICRYLRIRMGSGGDSGKDAVGIADGGNMIFDHISVSWGRDETFSINGSSCADITIQNSVIAQGLLSHSAGGLIQPGGGVTLYRNLYVDNDTRNNKIKGTNQYVNNVVYNWSSGAYLMGGESEGISHANCVSNYFINGPENSVAALSGANANFNIYAADNWWDRNRNGSLDGYLVPQNEYSGGPTFQPNPYDYPAVPTWPAQALVDSLLPEVGASLPYRDLLDYYVVDQVRSYGKKGAIITNESENSIGIPTAWAFWTGSKRTDTDNDGMPDAWETANGLNAGMASDALAKASNGYLNIENYINSITDANSQPFLRAPLCLVTDSTTQNNVYLSWFDFTGKEKGYAVERRMNGSFVEIGRTGINVNKFMLGGLKPEQKDTFRVRAFNDDGYSSYSNTFYTKTKPIPVEVLDLTSFKPDFTWNGTSGASWDKTTSNWLGDSGARMFTDSSNVKINANSVQNIVLNETAPVNALVVNTDSAAACSIQGTGSISGKGSVNKTGSGSLSLLTNNTYTGATVLYDGTLYAPKILNGGTASSIGASQNYAFNCVLKGGTLFYTGASASTDRNMLLEGDAGIGVNSGNTLTVNGTLSGNGGLTKKGAGVLTFKGLNTYEGLTRVDEGQLNINGIAAIENAFASGKEFLLNGGHLKTSGGSSSDYEDYYANIQVADGKTSYFEPNRLCYLHGKVSGKGTLYFNITYVREYIQGDWSEFSGTVVANSVNSDGTLFMLDNKVGIPNARVVTTAGTRVVCWKNASTMYLGGLSGPSGSWLSGADKQNNSATMTWIIGGAGTDETFNGVINNECANNKYKGVNTIIKDGNGYWKLTGANIYSGPTIVRNGTLIVNGTHTGAGKVTVQSGAILAGIGRLPGVTEVQSGGTISAGDPSLATPSIGTLTTGALTLQRGSITSLKLSASSADRIASTGAITYGGTLSLTVPDNLTAGRQFTLFTGTSHTGSFDSIVPRTPGTNLAWEFSGGVLKVVPATALKESRSLPVQLSQNPVQDRLELRLDQHQEAVLVTVESLAGAALKRIQVKNADVVELDFSDLPAGCYLLRLCDNTGRTTLTKVMKR